MPVLIEQFRIDTGTDRQLPLRYNVAPTQDIPVIRQTDAGRELADMRWGLIPSFWSKNPAKYMLLINARAETLHELPSFRSAFRQRRCLIPADGYYEWTKVAPKKKQPYLFEINGGEPFAFAGLWEHWEGSNGPAVESCTIITTEANELALQYHNRMPAILSPNDYEEWLNAESQEPGKLLATYPVDEMTATAVNPIVNNARNETPECVEPVE